ncbi:MAG TPA: DUF126 domain-containing protein [Myxococcota bacterium]|nr:DUF126 domain-containing protein [Myxococcota bacterium]HRY94590.1 DUF126 domain-containing protein [Myxococcota bacterium]HSA20328.1 DUF126 domain-containing protein [Myxococcota bacterium]
MKARPISSGRAAGPALVSPAPISFYGGVEATTGVVIERGHPLCGRCVAGQVLVFPAGKGSTVGSYVLYGLARNGVAPAALVVGEAETIVATGAILADIPCVDRVALDGFRDGEALEVDADRGEVRRA